MSELKSKKLYNFAPQGCYDEDLMASFPGNMKKAQEALGEDANVVFKKEVAPLENAMKMRKYMDYIFEDLSKKPHYVKLGTMYETTSFMLPGKDNIKVYVHVPHSLKNEDQRVGILYAHGGGVISGTAKGYQPVTGAMAVETQCVVFSVEYRLAPETKCPDNVKDFYNALKYIHANSSSWRLNPDKIVISGESGGGYITFGTMVMLAQNNESSMVRMAIPIIPMISDYGFSDTAAMTTEERACANQHMDLCWEFIAQDLKAQWSDPLLFPAKASDELIKKMVPAAIISAEFDIFITETERMVRRMRQNGGLLEFCCIPGITHGAYMDPDLKCYRTFNDCYKQIVDEYVKQ